MWMLLTAPPDVRIPTMGSCWPRKSKVPRMEPQDGLVFSAVVSSCPHDHSVHAVPLHLAHQKDEGIRGPPAAGLQTGAITPQSAPCFSSHNTLGCIERGVAMTAASWPRPQPCGQMAGIVMVNRSETRAVSLKIHPVSSWCGQLQCPGRLHDTVTCLHSEPKAGDGWGGGAMV